MEQLDLVVEDYTSVYSSKHLLANVNDDPY